jgi:hypothetical protein
MRFCREARHCSLQFLACTYTLLEPRFALCPVCPSLLLPTGSCALPSLLAERRPYRSSLHRSSRQLGVQTTHYRFQPSARLLELHISTFTNHFVVAQEDFTFLTPDSTLSSSPLHHGLQSCLPPPAAASRFIKRVGDQRAQAVVHSRVRSLWQQWHVTWYP